jgi:hypothetical protein
MNNFEWKKIFNPITIVIVLIIVSGIILIVKLNSKSVIIQPPIPPLSKDCNDSLVWSPLCFVIYVTNLNIDWQLTQPGQLDKPGGFNLQTFQYIKNVIIDSGYTPKQLFSVFKTADEALFQSELEKRASDEDKVAGTDLSTIETWSEETKIYQIIKILSFMKIVRSDFIKNISQKFMDCMYEVFKKYKGPKAYSEDKTSSDTLNCLKTILPSN